MNGNMPTPEERKLHLDPLVADAPPLPAETLERIRAAARRKAGLDAEPSPTPADRAEPARMRRPGRRRWWIAAAVAVILLGGILIAANPDAAVAAIQSLVRLVPGIGLTETDVETLVLPEPVTVEKGDLRFTVTGLISDQNGTKVKFLVEGLPMEKHSPPPPDREAQPELRLPDGTVLEAQSGRYSGGAGTARGDVWFSALPAGTRELTFFLPSRWYAMESVEVALPVVDAASAGLAEARAGSWSDEQLGVRLGVPHWTTQGDRIILVLDTELPEGMEPHGFGQLGADDVELFLMDDQGRTYPLLREESQLHFNTGELASATFQGPVAPDVRSLRLRAEVLRVTEDAEARLRVPIADLPLDEPLQLDRQLDLGSRSITVTAVTRLAEDTFRFDLDVGPEQDGVTVVQIDVDPNLGLFHTGPYGWSSIQTMEGRLLTVEFSQHTPPVRNLDVIFNTPELALHGGWEVELPLE